VWPWPPLSYFTEAVKNHLSFCYGNISFKLRYLLWLFTARHCWYLKTSTCFMFESYHTFSGSKSLQTGMEEEKDPLSVTSPVIKTEWGELFVCVCRYLSNL
jgi:hypothetical protein